VNSIKYLKGAICALITMVGKNNANQKTSFLIISDKFALKL
jgi:purine nucleoside permease